MMISETRGLSDVGEITSANEFFESLSETEHERWADYMRYFLDKLVPAAATDKIGGLVISEDYVSSLRRLIETPYSELTEGEKNGDREQVLRTWARLRDFVADWLAGDKGDRTMMTDHWIALLAGQWRREMNAAEDAARSAIEGATDDDTAVEGSFDVLVDLALEKGYDVVVDWNVLPHLPRVSVRERRRPDLRPIAFTSVTLADSCVRAIRYLESVESVT